MSTRPDPIATIKAGLSPAHVDITRIMKKVKATYFEPPIHGEILQSFNQLLQGIVESHELSGSDDDDQEELRGLIVSGQPRAGKSRILKQIFGSHPSLPGYGKKGASCPIHTVVPRGSCTIKRFGADTLARTGLTVVQMPSGQDYEITLAHMIRDRLRMRGIKILHIEEAQHITQAANAHEIVRVINMFKCLMIDKDWPIALVMSGIPDLVDALQAEDQITGRLDVVDVPSLQIADDGPNLQGILRELATVAGLKVGQGQAKLIVPRLIHAGNYQLGRSIEIVYAAIRLALGRREPDLTLDAFARTYRRTRAVAPERNPFLARDWVKTDPLMLRASSKRDRQETALAAKKRSKAQAAEEADL